MSEINPSIFKTYDIRGIYPEEIDAEAIEKIATAQAKYLNLKFIAIGYDARISSPEFAKAAREAFIKMGVNVYDIGQVPIEVLYFACGQLKTDGGMMITASHNPREYNGIKMVREDAKPLTSGSGLEEVKEIALETKEPKSRRFGNVGIPIEASGNLRTEEQDTKKRGEIKKVDIWPEYLKKITSLVNEKHFKAIKIACDASNGVGGKAVEQLAEKLPIEVIKINFKPDGNFPNHEPNPMISANREQLRKACLENKDISLGVIFDGDADRAIFLDENGQFIDTDFTAALVTKILFDKNPGQPIVYDLRRGWAVKDQTEILGSKYYPSKSGYPFIKAKMRDVKAIFGGEASAHCFYRDFFYSDSSAITLILILEFLSKNNLKMSEAIEEYLEAYFMYEETNFKISNQEKVFEALEKEFSSGAVDKTDGLSISFDDWHLNIRGSNTQPLVRLNIEGKNPEIIEIKRDKIVKIIEDLGGIIVEE